MLSSFVNLEKISVQSYNLTSIPDNAFQSTNGLQNQLSEIHFFQSPSLVSIGNNAFKDLKKLERLDLYNNNISHIPSHAFAFQNPTNTTLTIDLRYNKLNSSSFEIGTFTNALRPLKIYMRYNNITYLDENIFSFLKSNDSSIDLKDNPINCSDLKNCWINENSNILKNKLLNASCNGNGKSIFDSTIRDFDHCPHY